MQQSRWFWLGLLLLTAARFLLIGSTDLSPEEAYLTLCAERLDFYYFQHGPLPAFLTRISLTIFGPTEFGARVFAPLLALGSTILFYRLARELFDNTVALWSVLAINLTPFFNAAATSMIAGTTSAFLWPLSLLLFWKTLHRASKQLLFWSATGLCFGLALLCHPGNLILPACALLFLSSAQRWRRHFKRPGLWLACTIMLLTASPFIGGGILHAPALATEWLHRAGLLQPDQANLFDALRFALATVGAVSPLIAIGICWAILKFLPQISRDYPRAFLTCFTLPVLVVALAISFRKAVHPASLVGSLSAGILLLTFCWQHGLQESRRKIILRTSTLALAGIMSLALAQSDLLRQWGIAWPYLHSASRMTQFSDQSKTVTPRISLPGSDPSLRVRGWKSLGNFMNDLCSSAQNSLNDIPFLIADSPSTASALGFHIPKNAPLLQPTPKHPRVHVAGTTSLHHPFILWPGYNSLASTQKPTPFKGRHALYITIDPPFNELPTAIQNAFQRTEIISVAEFIRGGSHLRQIKVYACYTYRGLPL